MKRALISVSNKTGVVDFAKELVNLGYEIISTGGTRKALEAAGLKPMDISDVTGFPEILDGRVKTLHPNVHGALLAIRDNEKHVQTVKEHNIEYIDIVCVNLYPFKETIARGAEFAECVENIDIGGPSMLRSASKNHKFVTVVCDNEDYAQIIEEIKANGDTTYETRLKLAAKAFSHTACYDALISKYMNEKAGIKTPKEFAMGFNLKQELRYGENPHQTATFYAGEKCDYSLAYANQLHGKELSYNNIQDANATLDILREFDEPAVIACKHMNPCGVGIGKNINEAWDKAYAADDKSIFGGIIATNQKVNKYVAEKMSQIFLELVIAPEFDQDAFDILAAKKNIRLMTCAMNTIPTAKKFVSVNGGILIQDADNELYADLQCVTEKKPTDEELKDLIFGYQVVKHVKSNAIVLVKDGMTVGVGAGQMNRSGAAEIAMKWAKSNGRAAGSVLASDAFFPFADTVELAHEYGITAIIQPGGSIKDQDSIDACNKYGIAMIFTGMRHFKH